MCLEGLEVPVHGGDGRGDPPRVRRAGARPPCGEDVAVVAVPRRGAPVRTADLFAAVVEAVDEHVDGAIPVVPIADTVKRVRRDGSSGTEDREGLALAQTPQAFRLDALREAHDAGAGGPARSPTTRGCSSGPVTVAAVHGDPRNFKITTLLDLARAQARMGGAGG